MTIRVQVNEISRESYKGKDGTQRNVTRLICVDKDNTAVTRFKGDLVVGVPSDQVEYVNDNVRRDDLVDIELHGVRVFGSQMAFEGRIGTAAPASSPSKAAATKP